MTALIIIGIVVLLIVVLLLIPAELIFDIRYLQGKTEAVINFKYALFKYTLLDKSKKKTKKKKKPEKKLSFDEAKEKYYYFKRVYGVIKHDIIVVLDYLKTRAIKIKCLNTDIKFDFENPMNTGIATGVVNGFIYNAYSVIDNSVGIGEKNINIEPMFMNTKFIKAGLYGIVRLKNVHIMVILIKLIKIYKKAK